MCIVIVKHKLIYLSNYFKEPKSVLKFSFFNVFIFPLDT